MRRLVLIYGLIFLVPCAAWSASRESSELVERARVFERERFYFSNPIEAQRLLREAVGADSSNIEARYLLARSLWRDRGKIEEALSLLREVVGLSYEREDDSTYQYFRERAIAEQDKIFRLFRPLQIRVLDRQIEVLSYASIRLSFRFPEGRLKKEQRKRMAYLQEKKYLQFVGVDSLGRGTLQIDYFPVAEQSGVFYSIVLMDIDTGREIRRSFQFTGEETKTVDIPWQEEWGDAVVESVPEDRIKLELPTKYRFERLSGETLLELPAREGYRNLYLPSDETVHLKLRTSTEERWKESLYGALFQVAFWLGAIYGVTAAR